MKRKAGGPQDILGPVDARAPLVLQRQVHGAAHARVRKCDRRRDDQLRERLARNGRADAQDLQQRRARAVLAAVEEGATNRARRRRRPRTRPPARW